MWTVWCILKIDGQMINLLLSGLKRRNPSSSHRWLQLPLHPQVLTCARAITLSAFHSHCTLLASMYVVYFAVMPELIELTPLIPTNLADSTAITEDSTPLQSDSSRLSVADQLTLHCTTQESTKALTAVNTEPALQPPL